MDKLIDEFIEQYGEAPYAITVNKGLWNKIVSGLPIGLDIYENILYRDVRITYPIINMSIINLLERAVKEPIIESSFEYTRLDNCFKYLGYKHNSNRKDMQKLAQQILLDYGIPNELTKSKPT